MEYFPPIVSSKCVKSIGMFLKKIMLLQNFPETLILFEMWRADTNFT